MKRSKPVWQQIGEYVRYVAQTYTDMHKKEEYPNGCETCKANAYSNMPKHLRETVTQSHFVHLFNLKLRDIEERNE